MAGIVAELAERDIRQEQANLRLLDFERALAALGERVNQLKADFIAPRPPALLALQRAQASVRCGLKGVEAITGLCISTIWRKYRKGSFPQPHYIGKRRMWLTAEVEAWVAAESERQATSEAKAYRHRIVKLKNP